jgi:hypothetical protein
VNLARRAVAEALGTAFLLTAVVGSGIMAERLCGDTGLALLANAIATGGALFALIVMFAPVSGAHLNPAVSLAFALNRTLPWRALPVYVLAQCAGAALGVVAAQLMFGLPAVDFSHQARAGAALGFSEFVATLGLLSVGDGGCGRGIHHGRLLVRRLDQFCQSSGDAGAHPDRQLRRHPHAGRAGLRAGAAGRGGAGRAAMALVAQNHRAGGRPPHKGFCSDCLILFNNNIIFK